MSIAVPGAAGLVGQNPVPRLKARGGYEIVAIDKRPASTRLLCQRRLGVRVVVAHAQIGGPGERDFRVPFTTKKLEALVTTPDLSAVADWPLAFDVRPTALGEAMDITFRDRRHATVALEA